MQSVGRAPSQREIQQRARFDALRRRIFDEMGQAAGRWRFTWIVPFHVMVLVVLVARGEPWPRAVVQGAAVAVLAASFLARMVWVGRATSVAAFAMGVLSYFVMLGVTGGLASPLIVVGVLVLTIASVTLRGPARTAMFGVFLTGFVTLALLSRTGLGALPTPLVPTSNWSTAEYVGIALAATFFTTVGAYRVGCMVSRGYEQAALELAERREELCNEGEDRTRALEGMVARLAHEVKNPLAAIKGLSTHMARSSEDPKTAERLAIVAAEADRLQSIVDGFLSFSRGLDDLKVAPVQPHEVARELAMLLEARASEAGVAIEVSGDEKLELFADARKLRQALLNLVLNAMQASPRGAAVRVAIGRECEGARVTVRDDGVGMTPEVLERIRKPYFTTKEGGTGLGVAVARGLVEQHGGRMEFKSAPGKGTTVTIVLPMKAKPCAMLPNPLRALEKKADPDGTTQAAAQAARRPEPGPAG